jgi:CRISPR/Cas system CSM-associated protein Csm5 (group 7 of RAMP superfamily)
MKYQLIIKSIAGTAIMLGSLNAAATGFGGGWKHDSVTGTLMNTNAPSYDSTASGTAMKSKKGSDFADGWAHDSNTGTLFNANAASPQKQSKATGDKKVTLNGFGGGWYQDGTGTLTYID